MTGYAKAEHIGVFPEGFFDPPNIGGQITLAKESIVDKAGEPDHWIVGECKATCPGHYSEWDGKPGGGTHVVGLYERKEPPHGD